MGYTEWLFLLGVVCIVVAAAVFIRVFLDLRQRILVTVSRPTTTDGETVQISSNLRSGAGWLEIGEHIEKASMAVQTRMAKQNEIVHQTQVTIAHQRWKKIKAKLESAEKEGRHGVGVLSQEERRFWNRFKNDFDDQGPKDTTPDDRIAKAAGDLLETPAEG